MDMCKDIPYNMTIYPNLLKHSKQEEAEMDIKQSVLKTFIISISIFNAFTDMKC